MTIYFYLGQNVSEESLSAIAEASDTFILFERADVGVNLTLQGRYVVDMLGKLEQNGRAYSIDRWEIEAHKNYVCEFSRDQRERILHAVLGDFKVFLLRMRYLRFDFEGAFQGLCYFSDIVDYTLSLVEKNRPEVVFCAYTPHTVEAWVVVRTLEELGARVIRLISSPLPWILLPVQGLSKPSRSSNLVANAGSKRTGALDYYISLLKGDYSQAMPYYSKASKKRLNPLRLLHTVLFWRPKQILYFLQKCRIRSEFLKAINQPMGDGPYAVYFLHYQPEMNTLPEADLYVDQFQAIKKITDALPRGINLLIREHPSTFSQHCDRRWRPAGFYRRLLALPNTYICPAGFNSFDVIDKAIFVASIAGVCLTEALARGKPAVTFFMPRFAKFQEGLVIDANASSVSELREIFSQMIVGGRRISEERLKESLGDLMNSGYDGALDDTIIPQSPAQSHTYAIRSTNLAIQDVLDDLL